jgi:hypothetical protein
VDERALSILQCSAAYMVQILIDGVDKGCEHFEVLSNNHIHDIAQDKVMECMPKRRALFDAAARPSQGMQVQMIEVGYKQRAFLNARPVQAARMSK